MTSNRRILHVTPFFPPDRGGIANHVYNLCSNLSVLGNEMHVASPRHIGSQFHREDQRRYSFTSFYLPGWPYPTLRSVSIPVDLGLKLDSTLRRERFDVIHVHGHHYPLSWMAINSAARQQIPSVITLHGMYALNPSVAGGKSTIEELFNKCIVSKVFHKANEIIGLTNQITTYAKDIAKESRPYHTIPNGVNTSIYEENRNKTKEYRSKYNISEESTVILFLGRLEQVKGITEFAKASAKICEQFENVEVMIVGEGSLESKAKSISRGHHRIHFLPWLPSDQVHELYIASDIFVIPSRFEALPLTVIEAMNAGLHIVYTAVGGISDILEGYLRKTMLADGSANDIVKTLSTLIPEYSAKEDDRSIAYARQFDWKNVAKQVEMIYSEIDR